MRTSLLCLHLLFGTCIVLSSHSLKDDTFVAPLYTGNALQSYGRYIVKLLDDVDVELSLEDIGVILQANSTTYNISRVFKHAIKAFAADLHLDALDTIRRSHLVEFVEEDVTVTHFGNSADLVPWGLDRIDQRDGNLNNEYDVHGNGNGVNVYVIDTGIKASHDEFEGRAQTSFDALGGDGEDCAGHGTHCAGIIGGKRYGVAKSVNLFGIRTMDCSGLGSSSDVIEALEWIGEHGQLPAVASISLGTTDGKASRSLDRAVEKVIEKGVTVVAAAGNSAIDACTVSPAKGEKVITVGATGIGDLLAPFSNTGACVDILAPGVNIESTWYKDDEPVKVLSGTSMACPHVTGAVALLLSKQPDLKPADVKRLLLEDATLDTIDNVNNACVNALLYVQ